MIVVPTLPHIQLVTLDDRQPLHPPLHRCLFDFALLPLRFLLLGLLQELPPSRLVLLRTRFECVLPWKSQHTRTPEFLTRLVYGVAHELGHKFALELLSCFLFALYSDELLNTLDDLQLAPIVRMDLDVALPVWFEVNMPRDLQEAGLFLHLEELKGP